MSIPSERPEIDDEPIPEMVGHMGMTASPKSVAQLVAWMALATFRFERSHLA